MFLHHSDEKLAQLKALQILGIKMISNNKKITLVSTTTKRKYSVSPKGAIYGHSEKSSWYLGKGGIEGFLNKVYNSPGHYLGS
jgi:hypothetical protein